MRPKVYEFRRYVEKHTSILIDGRFDSSKAYSHAEKISVRNKCMAEWVRLEKPFVQVTLDHSRELAGRRRMSTGKLCKIRKKVLGRRTRHFSLFLFFFRYTRLFFVWIAYAASSALRIRTRAWNLNKYDRYVKTSVRRYQERKKLNF